MLVLLRKFDKSTVALLNRQIQVAGYARKTGGARASKDSMVSAGSMAVFGEDALPSFAKENLEKTESDFYRASPSTGSGPGMGGLGGGPMNDLSDGHLFSPHKRLESNFYPKTEKEIIDESNKADFLPASYTYIYIYGFIILICFFVG